MSVILRAPLDSQGLHQLGDPPRRGEAAQR